MKKRNALTIKAAIFKTFFFKIKEEIIACLSSNFVPNRPFFALEASISCLFFAFPYTAHEQREIKSEEDWKQR